MPDGRITTARTASSCSMSRTGRSRSITTTATLRSNPTATFGEEATMGHCYHHALSSVRKWGGIAEDYLPLHQWFDESKAITADRTEESRVGKEGGSTGRSRWQP